MKKKYSFKSLCQIWLALMAIAVICACNNIDYDGEYSEDGYYRSNNQVYFYYASAADTLVNYSFGPKSNDTISHTVFIPVRLAGVTKDQPQTFKVVVDGNSTAVSGEHYTALDTEYTLPAGACMTYIPVELLRSKLSDTKDEGIKLVLTLVNSESMEARFIKNNKVTITWDNVLQKPDFWSVLEMLGMGAYAPSKHRMLLDKYDGDVQKIYYALTGVELNAFYDLYYKIIEVENYFKAHPEEL